MNEKKMFCTTRIKELLRANGLESLDAVLSHGNVIHRRYNAKSVSFFDLNDGEKEIRVYIKRQWKHARIFPRRHTILSGNALKSCPLREWNGLHSLRGLGLDVAEPLALFRHRWHPFKAAILTRAVPGEYNLQQMIEDGSLSALDENSRESLFDTLVSVIRTIHDAGFGWRGMNIKHFYPVKHNNDSWKIWLLDCEGIFSRVKARHVERERRTIVRLIRRAGNGMTVIEDLADKVERKLLGK